jgi:membrane-associated protein
MVPDTGLIGLILHYKYAILVVLGVPEGPIISIISGFLWRMGLLQFIPMYLALIAADMLGDMIWYAVGYHWGPSFVRRFGHLFSITDQNIKTVERLFHRHKTWVLFISKVTTGFGFSVVTLMTAGLVKIPFRRYMTINFLGQFIWTGMLIAIGYSFGHLYEAINTILWKMTVTAGMLILLSLLIGYGKYLRGRILRSS